MKSVLLVTFCVFFGFILGFSICLKRGSGYQNIRGGAHLLKEKLSLLPRQKAEKEAVFLLGDSLVKRGDWRGLEKSFAPINLGQGGARVRDVVDLIQGNPEIKGQKGVILVGINNLADRDSVEKIISDYKDLYQLLKEREIHGLVFSIAEVAGPGEFDRRPTVRVLNMELRKLSSEWSMGYMNMNEVLSDGLGVKEGYLSDELHLTVKAYRTITPLVLKQLK